MSAFHLVGAGKQRRRHDYVRWQFLFWFPREDAPADHKGGHCGKKKFRVVAAASWCSPSHDRHHKRIIRRYAPQVLRINSGNLAIFAAIRLASSLESNFTAERRSGFAFLDKVRLGIVLYWSARRPSRLPWSP